ncbi:MAG: DALR anticodon-binding domain-containing protein [Oculatellaceae cyanobacterium bins.114]|nr:DALR anticodon-binding domain-containing protein [Oculatellaceae cyanobacterium bins.114]
MQINPSGWISLQLNETGTALWLQLLVNSIRAGDCPTINQGYETDIHQLGNFTNSSFIIQYTHARCCSLLHLAHQAELIELDNAQPHWRQSVPLIAVPNSLPWLDAEHRLRFQQITEWQLITQCVVTLDRLAELASSDVVTLNRAVDFKLAMELSQTFQAFHAACPLLGEAQKASLELAQVRLGLISVTQGLLNLLLQEGIGVMAPVCL